MKIRNIEIDFLSLELADPYTVAYETFDKADLVFIRLDTGEISGWGCMAPDPQVTGEHARLIYPEASEKLPDLLRGSDPLRRAKIMDRIRHEFPNHSSLQAAVDMALWDILGKKAGLPVWKILGGYRSRIETSVTIGICPVEDTLRYAESHIDRGFRILKIKGGLAPEDDLERLVKLRERFGNGIRLRFDANQGYSYPQALWFIGKVQPVNLELLEQPTRQGEPEHLGLVKHRSTVPVMADESLVSLMDAFRLAKRGLVDLINIKIMKVGGISEAIQVDSVARSAKIGVMVGCMDESALGISAGLQFALSRKNIRFADLDGHLDLLDDPAYGTVIIKDGQLFPTDSPGLGWNG
jgi:L-alanine-DL-glutamate epimerase-like enolase superfamily enzyme